MLGTDEGLQRIHQRLPRRVWEGGKESRRRTWGQQVGVQQKLRRQEESTASLGCKVTVAVGGKETLIPRISLCRKEEVRRDATLHGGGEREADKGDGLV